MLTAFITSTKIISILQRGLSLDEGQIQNLSESTFSGMFVTKRLWKIGLKHVFIV